MSNALVSADTQCHGCWSTLTCFSKGSHCQWVPLATAAREAARSVTTGQPFLQTETKILQQLHETSLFLINRLCNLMKSQTSSSQFFQETKIRQQRRVVRQPFITPPSLSPRLVSPIKAGSPACLSSAGCDQRAFVPRSPVLL